MKIKLLVPAAIFLLSWAAAICAQPRPITEAAKPASAVKPAPETLPARYEGGIIGYSDRAEGTLKFDDANERLVFLGSDQKELFGIPYDSLLMVYGDEKSVTSTTGNVISAIPIAGAGLGKFIKEKRSYLILQYDDPDVDARGTTSFKLENGDILESVIYALGAKAKLKQRGEAFIRPKKTAESEPN